jgi:hypothetical protein
VELLQLKNMQKGIIKGLILACILICASCGLIGAGSYPYAETFEIKAPEAKVIQAVMDYKAKHPESVVPLQRLTDCKKDSTDYWYNIYFYLPETNQIVHCWTRPSGKNKTTFAIVGINEGLELGNWRRVNSDFGYFENREILKQLEEKFVTPIQQIALQ